MHPKPFVRGRSWGSRSHSQLSTAMSSRTVGSAYDSAVQGTVNAAPTSPHDRSEEKPSHDASVFVGSLPCNVEQGELTKLLMEHLIEYAEVKSIKVIRDSKGGICAFVQCQSADAASNLIQNLHAERPKPFMGRILRFEPARAFRTLLISYRAPSYAINDSTTMRRANPVQPVHMLDLPTAMRISKAKMARFHNITYNVDAIEADSNPKQDNQSPEDISILLHPLEFDEDTIRKVTSYFGRVEKFALFQPIAPQSEELSGEHPWEVYPPPHDAPRALSMETGCWEVKWDFRDDCVAALMALRRVPHLSVTWAHQPSYSGWEARHSNYNHLPHAFQTTCMLHPPFSSFDTVSPPVSVNVRPKLSPELVDAVGVAAHTNSPGNVKSQASTAHMPRSMSARSSSTERNSGWEIWTPTDSSLAHLPSPHPANHDCLGQQPDAQVVPSFTPNSSAAFGLLKDCTDEDKTYTYAPNNLSEVPTQRSIDPTSLFVGGLEALGPSAWDEEKVRQHFTKYGGLQTVKFVKPYNAVTGFAFLKFDNIDGPARAVVEEHNRVCNGHLLRVRLRDCNPPRNPWKHGRGRGRLFHHFGHGHRNFHFVEQFNAIQSSPQNPSLDINEEKSQSSSQAYRETSPSQNSHASPSTDGQTLHDETPSPSASEKSHTTSSAEREAHPPTERYREWYDDLEVSTSAQSLAVSSSMTMFPPPYPYVFPNMPYYGPPPWVPPYMHHQAPYPMPYFNAYPLYPPIVHAAGHPVGEQDLGLPQAWSPQGVVYSSPYYTVPGVARQPTGTGPFNVPGANSASQTDHADPIYTADKVNQAAIPSASAPLTSLPSDPPLNPRPPNIPFPNHIQTTNGPSRLFVHQPWNNNARMVGPPVHLAPLCQPPTLQQNPFVAEPHFPSHSARKRQSFIVRRESQLAYHGNRNLHTRTQTNRVSLGNSGQNQSHQVSLDNFKGKGQPPVFV